MYHEDLTGDGNPPTIFPAHHPHPFTKTHASNRGEEIEAMGPIGLLIAALNWNGLASDKDFKV